MDDPILQGYLDIIQELFDEYNNITDNDDDTDDTDEIRTKLLIDIFNEVNECIIYYEGKYQTIPYSTINILLSKIEDSLQEDFFLSNVDIKDFNKILKYKNHYENPIIYHGGTN